MLIGLDHVIIAVRDLSRAKEQLEQALGLTGTMGGEHPGLGTHNAIVRFGTEYIELISVRDPREAAADPHSRLVMEFLDRWGEGLLGFALGSDDLDRDVAEARDRGLPLEGPFPGARRRPDGSLITWRRAGLPEDPWGRALPFLIQHDTSLEQRRSWVPPEGHSLRASGMPLVSVAVADLDASIESYRRLLSEPPEVVEEVPALPARRARFAVGSSRVELLEPAASNGGLADFVRDRGDGLFMITLMVPDIDRAYQFVTERGTSIGKPTFRRRSPLLNNEETLGARFQLWEGR